MRRQFNIILKYNEELVVFPGPGVAPSPSRPYVRLTLYNHLLRGFFLKQTHDRDFALNYFVAKLHPM